MASGALGDWGEWIGARIAEFSASIHFLTRLPLPRHDAAGTAGAPGAADTGAADTGTAAGPAGAKLAQAAWAFPLAGFVVGLIAAITYAVAHKLVLFAWPAAALTLVATLLVTGALHEDGLADTADGFGGGDTRERKLAIMRDSRIGTYGVCALIISLLIRADAIASLTDPVLVAPALLAAHVGARAVLPWVMFLVPAARTDGLGFAAGQPSGAGVAIAGGLGFLALLFCLGLAHALIALVVLAIVVALVCWLAARQIGGHTGDVLGAVEQVSEIVILLVALR
jgi:adenosylcobinamide-GDP ribazoletransferase